MPERQGEGRSNQLGEDRRGAHGRDAGNPFVELGRPLDVFGDHAKGNEIHGNQFLCQKVTNLMYDTLR